MALPLRRHSDRVHASLGSRPRKERDRAEAQTGARIQRPRESALLQALHHHALRRRKVEPDPLGPSHPARLARSKFCSEQCPLLTFQRAKKMGGKG